MTQYYSEHLLNQYSPLIANLVIYLLAITVLSLAFRAFICVAVNYDAKARGVKEKTLYTVLSFFFPLIVGIVYLCTRKNCKKIQPKICNNCHTTVDTNSTFCPNCLGTDFTDYLIRDNEKYHKNAKIFLIIGIAVYVVTCVVNVFFNIYFDKNAEPFINDIERYSNYLDNYDDKDDYDNHDYSNHFDADGYFDDFGFPKDGEEETQPDNVLPNSLQ